MATQFNYNLTPQIPQTSIGDMINLARNVQAYQQAQQLNPLQLQQAQQNLLQSQLAYQQAQQMNPLLVRAQQAATTLGEETLQPKIQQQLAETGTAKTREQKTRLELSGAEQGAMFTLLGGIINDPRVRQPDAAKDVLSQARDRAVNLLGQDPDAEKKVTAVFKPLEELVGKKPEALPQVLSNIIQSNLGAAGQQALQTPQPAQLGGQPALFYPGQGQYAPAPIAPAPGMPPQAAPQGAPQAMQGQLMPSGMQLPYPVRQAGMPFSPTPSEEADRTRGQTYRSGLTARQADIPTARRNLDEVIKEATKIEARNFFSTGIAGDLERKFRNWAGDPTYKQLSKDLANVQIANIQAVGGSLDTVAGQQLARMANGDETFPPSVLVNIARRTYADLTNLDMQTQGAQKFAQKYGDANINAFRQAWANNADSKVFEAISIYNSVQDPAQRKKMIDDLLGNDERMRQQFLQRYKNIKKLTETGEL
jgi:hypothetical protein